MKTLIRLLLLEQSDLGWHCLHMLFYRTDIQNFRTFTILLIVFKQNSKDTDQTAEPQANLVYIPFDDLLHFRHSIFPFHITRHSTF